MQELAPGEHVDRYIVEAEIGRGGHARVYRVRHAELGVVRALKVLLTTDPNLRSRLLAEGRVLASIRHPNLVEVFDVLRIGDQPALVMEFVAGGALSGRISRGDLTLQEIEHLFRGVCAGVAAIHGRGVIHRDLKPENVLLDDTAGSACAKVSDFGIARVAGDGERTHLTRTHGAMGSPLFMAPEQARDAKEVDGRADLWSLGALLYEMLTGQPPFTGKDWFEVLQAAAAGHFIDVRLARVGTPERLAAAIDACLKPDRDHRPDDVAALLRILDDLPNHTSPAPPIAPPEDAARARPSEPPPGLVRNRPRTRVAAMVAWTAAGMLASWWGLTSPIDALVQSPILRLAGRDVQIDDVVVVALPPTAELRALRPQYPSLIDGLVKAHATAIVLDVTLTAAESVDGELAAAITRAAAAGVQVIVPVKVDDETITPPASAGIAEAATLGHAISLADLDRGWVRSARILVYDRDGRAYFHVSALAAAASVRATPRVSDGQLVIGPLRNHATRNTFVFPPTGPVPVLDFGGALDLAAGRIAVVGAMQADGDLHATADGPAYGCEVLAKEIQTLLRQAALRTAPPEVNAISAFIVGLLSIWLARRPVAWRLLPWVGYASVVVALAAGGVVLALAAPLVTGLGAGSLARRRDDR